MQKKAHLRKKLADLKIQAILVTDLINIRYLTGFTGSSGYLIITQKDALLVTDFRYKEQVKNEVKGVTTIIETGERAREIKGICDTYGIRKLGFEDHSVSFGFYKKLQHKKITLKPVSQFVEGMRQEKSRKEREYILKASKRAERAFRKLQPFIKSGSSEMELALRLEALLKEEGCKSVPFEVIVASGPRSALPHARPTHRRLRGGDFVVFDWGGECNGYFSDMTRTILIKNKDISRQRKIYDIVLNAQQRAIASVRAGVSASDIDAAARSYIKDEGYEEFFGHGTGHGVGLAVHEKPVVSWRSKEIIKSNMVFTIEPGIYIPDFGGVRIEDLVEVRRGGAELLTSLPKRLNM